MRYTFLILIAGFLLVGCDSFGPREPGLDVDAVNDAQLTWEVKNVTRSRVVTNSFSGSGMNIFIPACDYEDCEVKLLAEPIKPPPEGCRGWKPITKDLHVPHDRRDQENWHLDEPELVPDDCDDENLQASSTTSAPPLSAVRFLFIG